MKGQQMTVYVYLRVSTDTQDAKNQELGVKAYAKRADLAINETFTDTESGATDWRKRKIALILEKAVAGDVLIVAEFSRIARSLLQILEVMQLATEKGLKIIVVKENMVMDDSVTSQAMAAIFGIAAMIERDLNKRRTAESIAARRAKGLPIGRPAGEAKEVKLDRHAAEIDKYLEMGLSKVAIAKIMDCQRATLYAWLERRRKTTTEKENDHG